MLLMQPLSNKRVAVEPHAPSVRSVRTERRRFSYDRARIPPGRPPAPPRLAGRAHEKGSCMNLAKKSAHTGETFKGRLKKSFGRLIGNRRMEAEGRGDQAKGDVKQAGENIKDAIKP